MKYCKKLLSVLLALALCGSMVAPAFATVTFEDLNNAINDNYTGNSDNGPNHGNGLGDGRYSYGDAIGDTWEIVAWDKDNGNGDVDRHVQVNTDITYNAEKDGLYTSISVGGGKDVNLDLGNHTVTGTEGSSVFTVQGGSTEVADEDPTSTQAPGELNITGGTITSAPASEQNPEEEQPDPSAGSSGGDRDGTPAGDTQSVPTQGGGINVGESAHLTLDGTKVEKNTAQKGGGIYAAPGAEVELKNNAEVSGNSGGDVYLDYGKTKDIDADNKPIVDGASINTPDGGTWTDDSGNSYSGAVKSSEKGLSLTWEPTNTSGSDSSGSDNTSNEVEIDDLDVPLVEGPVSCAEFIHKMWTMDGEPAPLDDRGLPESVDEDHEYAQAIAWAVSAGIVSVETFDPEELLTVALAREFLTSFAAYADMVMPELTTLTGEDESLVLNSDEVLAEFFDEKDNA